MHLFYQIEMQTFLGVSANFYKDCWWYDLVSVYLIYHPKYQSWSQRLGHNIYTTPGNKKLTTTISHDRKALMILRHDVPNIHVLGFSFFEFLINALSRTDDGSESLY